MSMLFREQLDERLRPLGITTAQLHVLAALSDATGPAAKSGAQISRYCQVTPQTTHALLSTAERLGWVARAPHPENAHTLIASLTPLGKRVFSRGRALALKLQSQMLRSLSAADVRQLEATLTILIANLHDTRTESTASRHRLKR
jgi:DNA-binding MarR family transcriptional regulator